MLTTVYQYGGLFRSEGGPCSINYFSYNGTTLYILRVDSTDYRDDATALIIGDSVKRAVDWLEGAAIECTFYVGSFFYSDIEIDAIKEPYGRIKQAMHHRTMVGDGHFSGLGEYRQYGSSLVYIPEDGGFRFGTYGVHQRTFMKLRDKLERVANRYGLP